MSSNPADLYEDVLVVIDRLRGINNGEPALHAAWLAAIDPQPGETVIHVGAGTGYYTAMLSRLVGPGGQVEAYEYEADLAAIAATNLATVCEHPRARAIGLWAIVAGNRYHLRQCRGDGAGRPLARCDEIRRAADLSLAAAWGLGAGDPGAAKAGRLFGEYPHERRLHPLQRRDAQGTATRRFPQRQTSRAAAPIWLREGAAAGFDRYCGL